MNIFENNKPFSNTNLKAQVLQIVTVVKAIFL